LKAAYRKLTEPDYETIDEQKRREHEHEVAVIAAVREAVNARDGGRCRFTKAAWPKPEMHEIKPRSATRGLPPEQRFNTRNCVMVAPEIHRRITLNQLMIVVHNQQEGADGELSLKPKPRKGE
jgi:hypothetical protein